MLGVETDKAVISWPMSTARVPAPLTPGEKIIAKRNKLGISQPQLAKRAGLSQQSLDAIEKNVTKRSRYLAKIAQILEIPLHELDDSLSATGAPAQSPTGRILEFTQSLVGEKNFPVYAAGEAGAGALIVSTDPVDYVRRPAPLAEVKDGYGLIVIGDSMTPELRSGDTALIHPHLPPSRDHSCVFYADDGHGTQKATIKSFIKSTPTHWHVEQWNPPRKFTLDRKEWQKCHLVVGNYRGR